MYVKLSGAWVEIDISGQDGKDGNDGQDGSNGADGNTPYVGGNGNWWIGETDTGIKAQGPKGDTGEPGTSGTPGSNGQDGTNGTDGQDGKDGKDGTNGIDGAKGDKGDDAVIPGGGCGSISGPNGSGWGGLAGTLSGLVILAVLFSIVKRKRVANGRST